MSGLIKRLYSPLLFDCLFTGTGSAAVVGIVLDASRGYPAIAPAIQPLIKGAALVGAIVAGGLAAMVTTRFDQKHADDYVYHTLTKTAFIAMFTLLFVLALWHAVFAVRLGGVSSYTTMCIVIASWSFSYFYTRIRGTGS